MRDFYPRSLRLQTLVILVAGMLFSHALALAIYTFDKKTSLDSTEAIDAAERIAGVATLLARVPTKWWPDVISGHDSRTFRVRDAIGTPAYGNNLDAIAVEVRTYLRKALPGYTDERIRVSHATGVQLDGMAATGGDQRLEPEQHTAAAGEIFHLLEVLLEVEPKRWIAFSAYIPEVTLLWPSGTLAYVLTSTALLTLVMFWLVNRVVTPLSDFAEAVDRLGRNLNAAPLPESGPAEVRGAARAMNEMQQRLRRFVDNRTEMLATISHDLRTPLTLMRLQVEMLDDEKKSRGLLAKLDDADEMIRATLTFARDTFHDEPEKRVDLTSLIGSICDDLKETGAVVEFEQTEAIYLDCRRITLKRALSNIIANALKYGTCAHVTLAQGVDHVEIRVIDDGPGVPEEKLGLLCVPFHRLEPSGGKRPGGFGLGLSIAQSIIHSHGGTLDFANLPDGGFSVRLILPTKRPA